jgi:superfamily II DNA or RNA helicase
MNLEIDNSFCRFTGEVNLEARELVRTLLTYHNDIEAEVAALYGRLKYTKTPDDKKKVFAQIAKLKATEWVCWFKDDTFPTGHLNLVKEALKAVNAVYTTLDYRKVPANDLILSWYSKPFEQRYYQAEMHALGMQEGRGVFESAVGTGKSLICAYLVKEISVISLIVVPSVGLGLQLEQDFKKWFGPNKVETIATADVRKGRTLAPIRIATIQTLASLQKTGELQALVADVKAIYIDEIHHAGSASYTNILPEIHHVYYRFGFSGTFLRNDSKSLDMWGFLSNVLYRYPAFRAIQEGFLTPIKVITHELPGKRSPSYPKEYTNNYCGNEHMLNRIKLIIDDAGDYEQILILVKNKDKSGKIIHEFLKQYGVENSYISGDDKKEVINSTIKAFNDKRVRVLIGSSVIGEGIDIRSTDQLIMAQGGKSEIVMVQAIGRAVRLYEGKKVAKIHDFDFIGTKYMQKHSIIRRDIYKRNFECEIFENKFEGY